MIRHLISLFICLAAIILIAVQTQPDGSLLIMDYLGLFIVMVMLGLNIIVNVLGILVVIFDDYDDYYDYHY